MKNGKTVWNIKKDQAQKRFRAMIARAKRPVKEPCTWNSTNTSIVDVASVGPGMYSRIFSTTGLIINEHIGN